MFLSKISENTEMLSLHTNLFIYIILKMRLLSKSRKSVKKTIAKVNMNEKICHYKNLFLYLGRKKKKNVI